MGAVVSAIGVDPYLCTQEYEDGSVFHGQCRGGMLNGQGKMVWANGDTYEGTYMDGVMHGQGIYKHSDGSRYQGQFRSNLRDGYGVFTFTDGSLYEGAWCADHPEGEGRVMYPGGELMTASFKEGLRIFDEFPGLIPKEAAGAARAAAMAPSPAILDARPTVSRSVAPSPASMGAVSLTSPGAACRRAPSPGSQGAALPGVPLPTSLGLFAASLPAYPGAPSLASGSAPSQPRVLRNTVPAGGMAALPPPPTAPYPYGGPPLAPGSTPAVQLSTDEQPSVGGLRLPVLPPLGHPVPPPHPPAAPPGWPA